MDCLYQNAYKEIFDAGSYNLIFFYLFFFC